MKKLAYLEYRTIAILKNSEAANNRRFAKEFTGLEHFKSA